jgi:hypothetical protein
MYVLLYRVFDDACMERTAIPRQDPPRDALDTLVLGAADLASLETVNQVLLRSVVGARRMYTKPSHAGATIPAPVCIADGR